jgi:hypothetical protein
MKRKEKLLTCLIYPLLERTTIQTGKEKLKSFFSFLFFSFRKKTTFLSSSFSFRIRLFRIPCNCPCGHGRTTRPPNLTLPHLALGSENPEARNQEQLPHSEPLVGAGLETVESEYAERR